MYKQIVLIFSGCDSGFGNALAKHLSKFDIKVYACCLNKNSAGANELKRLSEAIQVIQLNITKDDDVIEAKQLIEKGMEQNEGTKLHQQYAVEMFTQTLLLLSEELIFSYYTNSISYDLIL